MITPHLDSDLFSLSLVAVGELRGNTPRDNSRMFLIFSLPLAPLSHPRAISFNGKKNDRIALDRIFRRNCSAAAERTELSLKRFTRARASRRFPPYFSPPFCSY